MALVLADRVRDTTTTTGTGTVTLSGTAPTGYQTFGAAIGNGNTTYYTINAGSQWEVGIGTYSSTGPTLARTTVLASSNSGSLVDFSTGTKDVFVTYPAEKSVNYDASDNVGIGTSSPTTKLDVRGAIASIGASGTNAVVIGDYGATAGTFAIKAVTGRNFTITDDYAGAERMRIDSSGNVGIGTSSPGAKFQVIGSTTVGGYANVAAAFGAGVSSELYLGSLNGNNPYIGSGGAFPLSFNTNGTERMRIDSAGQVGIGVTPNAWSSSVAALQLPTGAFYSYKSGTTSNFYMQTNAYFDGSNNIYKASNFASQYLQSAGQHIWYNAPSGTAGNAISFTQAMTLDTSGRLFLNATTGVGNDQMLVAFNSSGSITQAINMRDNNASGNGNSFLVLRRSDDTYLGAIGRSGTDSAMFVEGNSYLTLRTGGTERMRIDSSGNVGIGTSSPVAGGFLTVGSGAGSSTAVQYLNAGSGGSALLGRISGSNTWFIGDTTAALGSGSGMINFVYGANPWIVYLNNAERMRIDSSGNVGIGTSSPTKKLSIETTPSAPTNGFNIQYSGSEVASFTSNAGTGEIRIGATGTGTYFPTFYSNNAERMRITSSGNVGINTTTPATNLEVNGGLIAGAENRQSHPPTGPVGFKAQWNFTGGDGETDFYNLYSTASTSFRFYQTTGSGTAQLLYNMRPSSHEFYTGGTERARINSSGFFLVGTTAPLSGNTSNEFKTTTAGSWPLTINSNDRGILHRQSSGTTGFYEYFEYNGGTNNGSISYSGGTTAYNTTSDYRLKKIDGPITNSGAYIDALNPVQGIWKADGTRFVGLVAHEVQEVSSTPVVTGEKDGEMMQQMDYSSPEIIANLIAEVQSLRARVAQLEGN